MTSDFDRLFAMAVAAIFGLYLLRCFAGAALLLCAQLPTRWSGRARHMSFAVTPRLVRRLLVLALGMAGAAGLTGPAYASGAPDLDRAPTRMQQPSTNALPSIDRAPMTADPAVVRVKVKAGDSLWRLAQRQLERDGTQYQSNQPGHGDRPPASAIDRQWRQWYKTNRVSIGHNPNIIRTGSWLTVPAIVTRASQHVQDAK